MTVYFNEIEPYAADWLHNLWPAAAVDERSIADVQSADLVGFNRCHFFAGIGGWEYALQLAGWPTPTAQDHSRGNKPPRSTDTGVPLSQMAVLAGRASPAATDFKSESVSEDCQARRDEHPRGKPLRQQALLAGWATPRQTDGSKNVRSMDGALKEAERKSGNNDLGTTSMLCHATTEKPGALNPDHSRWLMGFPIEWANSAPTETRSSRKSRRRS